MGSTPNFKELVELDLPEKSQALFMKSKKLSPKENTCLQ